ncbi:MAG: hypothetical protein ACYCO9_08320 [Streptosporangiaceae bacterium]
MLRLALVLLIAMAGFGVVLAMVALVVSAGTTTLRSAASAKALRPATAAHDWGKAPQRSHRQAARQRTTGRRSVSRPRPGRTIASFTASGSVRTAGFTIPRTGRWGLRWHYSCPVGSRPVFVVSEADTSLAHTLDVSRSLPRGRGMRWIAHDAGRHRLLIVADCAWTVAVVLPAR